MLESGGTPWRRSQARRRSRRAGSRGRWHSPGLDPARARKMCMTIACCVSVCLRPAHRPRRGDSGGRRCVPFMTSFFAVTGTAAARPSDQMSPVVLLRVQPAFRQGRPGCYGRPSATTVNAGPRRRRHRGLCRERTTREGARFANKHLHLFSSNKEYHPQQCITQVGNYTSQHSLSDLLICETIHPPSSARSWSK